jgi:CheY-like chemotaxis protein
MLSLVHGACQPWHDGDKQNHTRRLRKIGALEWNGIGVLTVPKRLPKDARRVSVRLCECVSDMCGLLTTLVLEISAMKVLLAEDDRDSRELLGWVLQKLGYEVVAVENGKEAWDTYRKSRFRLVISDLLMPDVDGFELCRRIRAHKNSKYTYIIVVTALIGKKDYLEGMEAGADDFVTKPFDPDELKARLRVAERIISFQDQTVEEHLS